MQIIISYLIISFIVAIILDYLAQSNIGIGDDEYDELMSSSIIRTIAIFIVSLSWIITLPIMIANNAKEA